MVLRVLLMHEWERAAADFVAPWIDQPYVVGALLAGSYVTGAPSARSDLDVVVLLAPGTKWRERGNRILRGYLIEYFANSAKQFGAYFAREHAQWRRNTTTMFVTGRILHDPLGHVQRLRERAERWRRRPLPRVKRAELAADRYFLWDMLDNLCDLHEQSSPGLAHAYHHYVHSLYEVYARSLRVPVQAPYQLHAYLSSARSRAKHRIDAHPDARFAAQLKRALQVTEPDAMRRAAERLYAHVTEAMGGFSVDGFRLRTPENL